MRSFDTVFTTESVNTEVLDEQIGHTYRADVLGDGRLLVPGVDGVCVSAQTDRDSRCSGDAAAADTAAALDLMRKVVARPNRRLRPRLFGSGRPSRWRLVRQLPRRTWPSSQRR